MVGRPSKYITRTQIDGTFDKNIITHLFTFYLDHFGIDSEWRNLQYNLLQRIKMFTCFVVLQTNM